ncbi:MAG TPA: hypothetical protein VGQ76_19930 [Thermoanaerobaculia bacterium]|jgi:hypothetical protein|nr:hypothetical protein [Thermoanaerobaculia bacterium]
MEQHIKVLSVLFIILGLLGIVFAVVILLVGVGAVATIISQDQGPDAQLAAGWIGTCLTVVAILFGILGIPSIVTGWGLSQRKSWSRIVAIIVAILLLPSFPVGTAIGIYALVILFNEESKRILTA